MPMTRTVRVIDVALVERLIARQFPQFADLPVSPVANSGWDNRTFHLGTQMSVRLPSDPSYSAAVAKEQRWLPLLAGQLPLPIPRPVGLGQPDAEYHSPWSIYEWLPGDFATHERVPDKAKLARDLANFLNALHRIVPTDGPAPANYPGARGSSLAVLDRAVSRAVNALQQTFADFDEPAVASIWRDALAANWDGVAGWLHGDVAQGNLLVRDGQLSAVIDFGSTAVGDPACDTCIAWTFLDVRAREVFRQTLNLDANAWSRGRGWALWKALIVCAGHCETNALEAETSEGTLRALVADCHLRQKAASG